MTAVKGEGWVNAPQPSPPVTGDPDSQGRLLRTDPIGNGVYRATRDQRLEPCCTLDYSVIAAVSWAQFSAVMSVVLRFN